GVAVFAGERDDLRRAVRLLLVGEDGGGQGVDVDVRPAPGWRGCGAVRFRGGGGGRVGRRGRDGQRLLAAGTDGLLAGQFVRGGEDLRAIRAREFDRHGAGNPWSGRRDRTPPPIVPRPPGACLFRQQGTRTRSTRRARNHTE